jgi:hypothetical protein
MEETQNLFETPPADPDKTLATPRFDEVEAQVARPVVPLSEMPAAARRRRSQWPVALILVSALAGGAISILAFRLYQQRQQQQPQTAATQTVNQPQEETRAPQTPAPEPTQSLTAAVPADTAQSQTPVVIESYDREKESTEKKDDKATRKAAEDDAKPARETARKEDRKEDRKVEEARGEPVAARARRVEDRPVARRVETITDDDRVMRRDDRGDDDGYERWRDRRRQRREERREGRRGGQQRNIDRIKDIFQGPPPA